MTFTSLEICAGGGGQALGLEMAGFEHRALVELDRHACATLRYNRPHWNVIQGDLRDFDGRPYRGTDLLAGGVPCPPFSKAGKQLGHNDERNLFPEAIRLVGEVQPRAVMLENVRGLLDEVFADYRNEIRDQVKALGYRADWHLFNASDFGVSQLRPRVVFVAVREELWDSFEWPLPSGEKPPTIGQLLFDEIKARGWRGAARWRDAADDIGPTVVGGSHKHGGPDLGPTRAKRAWQALGVDGHGLADAPPDRDFVGIPRLTVQMVARIQGFPASWPFVGGKTAAYRQVGNAFPPPVAAAVASKIRECLGASHLKLALG